MSDAPAGPLATVDSKGRAASGATTSFILLTLFLDALGIGLIIPVGPRLVAELSGGGLASASHRFGVLMALYSAMQLGFSPVLGGLSDRFGRRTVLLPSLLGAAASYLLSAFAPSLSWLYVGRVIAGITGASFSAATASIADTTPPDRRAQSFGMAGAAFGLGFVVGPVIGGALGGVSLRLPYAVAAALNLGNFLFGLAVLPETLRPASRRPFSLRRSNPLGSMAALVRTPALRGLAGTVACGFMAQSILQSVWALSGGARYGWSTKQVGLSLGLVGLSMAVVQGGLVRVLMRRFTERQLVTAGLSIGALGFVALGLADRGWLAYALIGLFALGGIAGPSMQALLTRAVGEDEQGELQGSLASVQSLMSILGPLVGTGLIARFGPHDASPHVPGAPFFAAAALNVLGLALALRMFAASPERRAIKPATP
ncbi:MAG: TCR/Tet family MFS transporter [Myxococcales bacterium]|nr:TCR/Tet family MFS transporter [Myxococcales bacterium]MBL0195528.1 TCR/Tet family MFS transporter [Myxococcales bacterium]